MENKKQKRTKKVVVEKNKKGNRIKRVCAMMKTDHLQMLSLFFDSPDKPIILPFTYIYTTFKKGSAQRPPPCSL